MNKFRLSFAFLLLALVLVAVPAAFAQDETLGLSQSDYDLWQSGWANLEGVTSASYDFTASFSAAGLGDTDASANLTGSGVLSTSGDNPLFQLDLTGSVGDTNQMTDVTLGVRVVDGYIYYNDGSGWKGETLDSAMSTATSMFDMGMASAGTDATVDPSQLASGDLSGLADMAGMGDAMSSLSALNPADFVSVVRSDVDGEALFTLSVDLGKLLSSPALAPMLAGAMGGGSSSDMTDAQMQQMGAMLGGMFSTATINVGQYVDTSTSTLNRMALDVNIPLDVVSPGGVVKVSFDLGLSGINEPVSVEAPADAVMMDAAAGG